jgi:hypothetical protein
MSKRTVSYRKSKPLNTRVLGKGRANAGAADIGAAIGGIAAPEALAVQAGAEAAKTIVPAYFNFVKPGLYGAAALGGLWVLKKVVITPKTDALFSAPVVVGGAGGYAAASALKLSTEMKVASAVMGVGIGWMIQFYLLTPAEAQVEAEVAEAEKAEHDANRRWYNPFSW